MVMPWALFAPMFNFGTPLSPGLEDFSQISPRAKTDKPLETKRPCLWRCAPPDRDKPHLALKSPTLTWQLSSSQGRVCQRKQVRE